MNRYKLFALVFIITGGLMCTGCADRTGEGAYAPMKHMDSVAAEAFKYSISRYTAHLPKKADYASRYDPVFDDAYRRAAGKQQLDAYFTDTDGWHYFLVSRVAPSIHQKRVATGGRLRYDSEGKKIEAYEEVFRTWKMEEGELKKKSLMLFDKMVRGDDLSPYYTVNTPDEDYIEFPDVHTFYNREQRRWEVKGAENADFREEL